MEAIEQPDDLDIHGILFRPTAQALSSIDSMERRKPWIRRILVDGQSRPPRRCDADQAHIQRLLSANCFVDHLTRTGMDVPTRELLTLSMLAALGGCDPQLKGHVAANVHAGNNRARLIDVVTQLLPNIFYPRTLNSLRAIDEVARLHQI